MTRNDRSILWRVYVLYFLVLVFGLLIVGRALFIQITEGEELMAKAEEQEMRYFSIEATRGNILSDHGDLLVTTIPVFEIRVDIASPHITNEIFNANIDSLSLGLSKLFGDRSTYQYKQYLSKARQANNRYLLLKREIDFEQLQQLREFPIFRMGRYKGGLIVIPKNKREYPYGTLAKRTLGYVNLEEDLKVGLEGAYSGVLKGIEGKQLRRRIANGDWKPVRDENEVEPQNGKDIVSTIDVNLQDVAEDGLKRHLEEHGAFEGCVVLMEVATGEIKAIANLRYDSIAGKYVESYNLAIGSGIEPGSTFKLASMIVALETGKVNLNDTVDTGDGWIVYYGKTMKDVHKVRDGKITYRESFELSSNVGISKMIMELFEDDPAAYVDGLYKLSINNPLGVEIPGEGKPLIRHPNDEYWPKTRLPWMSIGYALRMTPLQVLTLYNAVANNGVMVKPKFIREIRYAGQKLEKFETEIINPSICSQQTIDTVQSLLEGVVMRGTAQVLKNPHYSIAGKTGTAKISAGRRGYINPDYNASFVGYFPADEPMFSCIVVVNKPRNKSIYGGTVAAPVFREIANKIYASKTGLGEKNILARNTEIQPVRLRGLSGPMEDILKSLDFQYDSASNGKEWLSVESSNSHYNSTGIMIDKLRIPDVKGLTARDASYLLQKLGLKVRIEGHGWVKKQSLQPGKYLKKGETITLYMSTS